MATTYTRQIEVNGVRGEASFEYDPGYGEGSMALVGFEVGGANVLPLLSDELQGAIGAAFEEHGTTTPKHERWVVRWTPAATAAVSINVTHTYPGGTSSLQKLVDRCEAVHG